MMDLMKKNMTQRVNGSHTNARGNALVNFLSVYVRTQIWRAVNFPQRHIDTSGDIFVARVNSGAYSYRNGKKTVAGRQPNKMRYQHQMETCFEDRRGGRYWRIGVGIGVVNRVLTWFIDTVHAYLTPESTVVTQEQSGPADIPVRFFRLTLNGANQHR